MFKLKVLLESTFDSLAYEVDPEDVTNPGPLPLYAPEEVPNKAVSDIMTTPEADDFDVTLRLEMKRIRTKNI
jgi:hypothetical protein